MNFRFRFYKIQNYSKIKHFNGYTDSTHHILFYDVLTERVLRAMFQCFRTKCHFLVGSSNVSFLK
jgi:hypothetical protein